MPQRKVTIAKSGRESRAFPALPSARLRASAAALCLLAAVVVMLLAAASSPAHAEEAKVSVNASNEKIELASVEISMELQINAPPARCYEAYVNEYARWYSRNYVMGGVNTVDFLIEAQPGGRLMEVWKSGGGMIWGQVISISPGRSIRIGIPEGVYWSGPGFFELSFAAGADEGTTLLTLTHNCTQQYSDDGEKGYLQGWDELIVQNFKSYCEGGRPENVVSPAG